MRDTGGNCHLHKFSFQIGGKALNGCSFFFLNQMLYFYGHTRVSVINALHAKRASSCGKKNSTPSKTPTKQVLPPQLFFIWMIKHCTSIRYMLWTQTSWFITRLLTHGPPTYFSLGFGSFSLVIIKAGEEY